MHIISCFTNNSKNVETKENEKLHYDYDWQMEVI